MSHFRVKEQHVIIKREPNVTDKELEKVIDDTSDHQTILNILLHKPEELELKRKPSGIRENKIFTLDIRKISLASAAADDNGVYVRQQCQKVLCLH